MGTGNREGKGRGGERERGEENGRTRNLRPVINVDTDFSTNRTFPYTTSPNIPIVHNLGGFGGDVVKFAQRDDTERIYYANMQFGRNWLFLTAYSPGTPTQPICNFRGV